MIPVKSQIKKLRELPATLIKKKPDFHKDQDYNECEQSSESYDSDEEINDERGDQQVKSPLINNISIHK